MQIRCHSTFSQRIGKRFNTSRIFSRISSPKRRDMYSRARWDRIWSYFLPSTHRTVAISLLKLQIAVNCTETFMLTVLWDSVWINVIYIELTSNLTAFLGSVCTSCPNVWELGTNESFRWFMQKKFTEFHNLASYHYKWRRIMTVIVLSCCGDFTDPFGSGAWQQKWGHGII